MSQTVAKPSRESSPWRRMRAPRLQSTRVVARLSIGCDAFGVEEVDGIRMHGIAHYLRLADQGRVDLTGLLTHVYRLEQWRDAFVALATQEASGAIKVAFDFR